jgi:uncharacterized protein YndB with AHSA1/START domain
MKFIQWTLVAIGTLMLLIVGVGLILPSQFEVQRSVDINAAPEKVYDLVVDTRQWKNWTVWNRRDPNMRIVYSGPPFGMGAKWAWESKTEGRGAMEFTRVEPNRRVEYRLHFPEFNMTSTGALILEPAGKGTRITWTNVGDTGSNPLKHYLSAMMDRMVGPDFEQGLANLKALAEKP